MCCLCIETSRNTQVQIGRKGWVAGCERELLVRFSFVHICMGPEWPFLCCWYYWVWFSWKVQLEQPHQSYLSWCPQWQLPPFKAAWAMTLFAYILITGSIIWLNVSSNFWYPPSFVQIILLLAAIFLRWLLVNSILLDYYAIRTAQKRWEQQGAGGVQIANESYSCLFKKPCV